MDKTLDATEVRVLGALIEKQLSTPEYYPMTLNALRQACNQKSNRNPVVHFSESDVMRGLDGLQRKRLVGTVTGSGSRVTKYRHAAAEALALGIPHIAVLGVLLLRGAQTVGELRARTGRMHVFESLSEVEDILHVLSTRDEALVMALPPQPGQKDRRHIHLLAGEPDLSALPTPSRSGSDAARLAQLESEVTTLKEQLATLTESFEAFRAQFE